MKVVGRAEWCSIPLPPLARSSEEIRNMRKELLSEHGSIVFTPMATLPGAATTGPTIQPKTGKNTQHGSPGQKSRRGPSSVINASDRNQLGMHNHQFPYTTVAHEIQEASTAIPQAGHPVTFGPEGLNSVVTVQDSPYFTPRDVHRVDKWGTSGHSPSAR